MPTVHGYPPPAQVIGMLMSAVFLDLLDQDAINLERVNRLIENVDGRIREVEWDGSAAEKFKGAWSTEYKSKLNMLVQLFNESATEVQKRIEALEAASR